MEIDRQLKHYLVKFIDALSAAILSFHLQNDANFGHQSFTGKNKRECGN